MLEGKMDGELRSIFDRCDSVTNPVGAFDGIVKR
jgi:hypothetical protein